MSNTLNVLASDPSLTYLPSGAWNSTASFGGLTYAFGNAQILYTFAEPATGISWYGSKSGSGGNAQVCIDCPVNSTSGFLVDYTDPSAGAYLPQPGIIAQWTGLTFAVHNISITNIYDPQAQGGQGDFGFLYFQGFQSLFSGQWRVGCFRLLQRKFHDHQRCSRSNCNGHCDPDLHRLRHRNGDAIHVGDKR